MDEDLARDSLTAALRELGKVVIAEHSIDDLLGQIVRLALATVRGADGVSATLVRDHEHFTSHATDDVVTELDQLQYALNDGPCVDAAKRGETVRFTVESDDDRFQEFARTARERFMTSVLAVPLIAGERTIGALNIYSASEEDVGGSELEIVELFAAQASALLANAAAYADSSRETVQLQQALQSRDLIGQAKGILMASERCTADEAFDILRHRSQNTNRKLVDIARDLIDKVTGG